MQAFMHLVRRLVMYGGPESDIIFVMTALSYVMSTDKRSADLQYYLPGFGAIRLFADCATLVAA